MKIDPRAIISSKTEIDAGVEVGPYSIIGEDVFIGKDTVIGANVVIEGPAKIGERNKIYQFVSIGTPPQDLTYHGEKTTVIIGNDNVIREFVTINRGSTKENWKTVIGNGNYLMAYAHVAHDCYLGNDIVMANLATLGGQ